MKASVFIATSLDGCIARPDGNLDWLPMDGGEPHGFDEFFASVDALEHVATRAFASGMVQSEYTIPAAG